MREERTDLVPFLNRHNPFLHHQKSRSR